MAAIMDLGLPRSFPHFCEGHGGQNFYLPFKEDKSTEKPTYALNGHGSGQKPPTTTSAVRSLAKYAAGLK